ncbi:MAG: mechanosensitive ion channel [Desulfuromonadales bacterium]|nr:mechanosensitive ion channel [Desulfuromonadales bacterium]
MRRISSNSRTAASGRRRLRSRRRPRRPGAKPLTGARTRLRQFRQATLLAVVLTSLLLLLVSPGETGLVDGAEEAAGASVPTLSVEESPASIAEEEIDPEPLGQAAAEEAARTVQSLWQGFYSNLPKLVVTLAILFLAWLLVRIFRPLLRRTLHRWERAHAVSALFGITVWALAAGLVLSVLAGDIRALVGSVGLFGLALSWALQTPIESFTGWLLNSFQGYYRVGDRVAVGDVFGDVYQIDFLTTTVWEIGSPGRGFVNAEQPTGRLITFPNNEVLAGTVVNLTRDFPFVWDELAVQLANESDMGHGMRVLAGVARELLGSHMVEPARRYAEILRRADLETTIAEEPQVFVAMSESWTEVVIRYLVHARERRKWKSELTMRVMEELKKPEHAGKLIAVYPRRQLQFVDPDGRTIKVGGSDR